MGMSTHVVGFKPPDERWQQMKAVWDACVVAKLGPPDYVMKFFNYTTPDANGVEISETMLVKCNAVNEWREESREGYEIVVANIPPDVKVIRVYNSY